MFVIPSTGFVVIDPETNQALPPEGMNVPASEYWLRRVRDQDVQLAPPSPQEESPLVETAEVVPLPQGKRKTGKSSTSTPAPSGQKE